MTDTIPIPLPTDALPLLRRLLDDAVRERTWQWNRFHAAYTDDARRQRQQDQDRLRACLAAIDEAKP